VPGGIFRKHARKMRHMWPQSGGSVKEEHRRAEERARLRWMRVLGTTLLVVAVLAAGPSASVAQAPPPSDPVGEILDAPAARRAGPAPAHPPSFASRVTGGAGEIVRAMPPAIL